MRRLYLQIYLAIVVVLIVFGALVAMTWHLLPPGPQEERALDGLAALMAGVLPADRNPEETQRSLERLSKSLGAPLTLWTREGARLAGVGPELAFPRGRTRSGWIREGRTITGALRLPDGRWLVARHRYREGPNHRVGLVLAIALLALAVAIGAYPLTRRLTRRLERLRAGVEGLGGGDLKARVPVEGQDEVAALAGSFNRAADRIEALVGAERMLLASASHELRTPLARIRVALELLGHERPDLGEKVAADIAELDGLIEELLLASRLQAAPELGPTEDVDLLGVLAEEAAHLGAEVEVEGQPATVRGDLRLLRRLVRNLLENAVRHGAPPVHASVSAQDGRARLRVCDRGPGVPAGVRERVFEAFYRAAPAAGAAGTGSGDTGAGLGLFLVRQIARRHGGEARCLDRDGGGACFEVDLPLR